MPTFGKFSDALARVPNGAQLYVQDKTGGRPTNFLTPDGQEIWTREGVEAHDRAGKFPHGQYQLKMVDPKLAMKARSIKIDFQMEQSEVSTGNVGPTGEIVTTTDTSLMADCLIRAHTQDRDRLIAVMDENIELRDENTELKVKIAQLELKMEYLSRRDTSPTAIIDRAAGSFLEGPGGQVLAAEVLRRLFPGTLPALDSPLPPVGG